MPRALFAGEYPPTNSSADEPHANPTSIVISSHIGYGRHDWIDIVPYSPVDTPSVLVDRRALRARVLMHREVQLDWIGRIAARVDECAAAGMVMPVIYIAGELCNTVWSAMSHERFTLSPSAPSEGLGVFVYKTGSTECLVMLDQPHNAKMLHSLGVARDIVPYAKLNARNLTRAVGKVLANDKLVKEAAAKQGRFIREESEGNGARYVELIIKGHDRDLGSASGSLSRVGGALI